MALEFGVLASALQALGYVLYISQSLRHEIKPNAATWFMFAYGTALLAILEYSRGAKMEILYLPVTCATLSIFVALICWKRGTLHWPKAWQDRFAFSADIFLTICYVTAWRLMEGGFVGEAGRGYANLAFLICSNLTTLSSFTPLIRGAEQNPRRERTMPWIVWATAYVVLGVTTFGKYGFWSEMMIYPAINAVLHARVAYLAHRHK